MSQEIDALLGILDEAIEKSGDPKEVAAYNGAKMELEKIRASGLPHTFAGLLNHIARFFEAFRTTN